MGEDARERNEGRQGKIVPSVHSFLGRLSPNKAVSAESFFEGCLIQKLKLVYRLEVDECYGTVYHVT